ncbi:MAG: hypothetical protein COA43_12180 [Robiginitomaculum sp.]|nr:MAG: hypothetical protein COA43_12180 [Robiginitomaculum sp.]
MKNTFKQLTPMLITCSIAGLVLTILAPYDTQNFSIAHRFIFWMGMCLAGGFGAHVSDIIILKTGWECKNWLRALAQSLTSSLAVVFTIILFSLYAKNFYSLGNFVILFFYIWVISATICFIGLLLRRQKEGDTPHTRPAIFERLKPALRTSEIYALAAEDHYVRVITSKGDDLILMRLLDAIKETAPLQGLSPHRSWWVSETGAKKVTKSEITLHSDKPVPISRAGLKHVKNAGWL